ncbi:MAG: penicillin-binding protein 2 [Rickettsiales bacterium]|jgi:cell division protein FtsI (penicillin-binding protein 3)|nr:penicillin-binding protein 2 [Rickettsiales bacterium]
MNGHILGGGFAPGRDLPLRWFERRRFTRMDFIKYALAALFLFAVARIFQLWLLGTSARPAIERQSGSRADIVDRNGVPLAVSLPAYELCANGIKVARLAESARALTKILPQLKYDDVMAKFKAKKECAPLARRITQEERDKIAALKEPGFGFNLTERRAYPHGGLFAHVLGGVNAAGIGMGGMEKFMDEHSLASSPTPLSLSVDMYIQDALRGNLANAMQSYGAKSAAGIVIDVKTGEVLGLASLPDFDSAAAGTYSASEPHKNHATSDVYELGSIMKIFNHALAVESHYSKDKKFDVERPLYIGEHLVRDAHFHKQYLDFDEAFYYSSNRAAAQIAEELGLEKQKEFFARFNFFDRMVFELPGLAKPILSQWNKTTGKTVAYGNGLAITMLHAVAGVNAIVGGGMYVSPTLLKRSDGDVLRSRQVVRDDTSEEMKRLMRLVLTEGTGRAATTSDVVAGGKTGTMFKRKNGAYDETRTQVFFVTSLPLESPKYTMMIMLDEAVSGACNDASCTAAPTARRIIEEITPLLVM